MGIKLPPLDSSALPGVLLKDAPEPHGSVLGAATIPSARGGACDSGNDCAICEWGDRVACPPIAANDYSLADGPLKVKSDKPSAPAEQPYRHAGSGVPLAELPDEMYSLEQPPEEKACCSETPQCWKPAVQRAGNSLLWLSLQSRGSCSCCRGSCANSCVCVCE